VILTVNIHPTAIKVARSGQGGRNVALEMTDATGSTVASIFPGTVEGWTELINLAHEGRARQVEADSDHAIAADVDEQLRRDGEALGRRIAADEGIEPAPLYVVWEIDDRDPEGPRRTVVTDPMQEGAAKLFAEREASYFAGRLEAAPARPEDLDDADGER
jgi:hypothetical protein